MALETQKKIVPQEIILSGDPTDPGFIIRNKTGSKVIEVTGNGKIGLFGKTPVTQAAAAANETADATYSANETAMLQKCYDVLKAVGLIA
jgi:hypothetical protein